MEASYFDTIFGFHFPGSLEDDPSWRDKSLLSKDKVQHCVDDARRLIRLLELVPHGDFAMTW